MYNEGTGVPQNYVEAVKWFRLAAEQGDHRAEWELGKMYEYEKGVSRDFVIAHMWYNIAAASVDASDSAGQTNYPLWRESIEKRMTAAQIAEAQELARKCTANIFKGCWK